MRVEAGKSGEHPERSTVRTFQVDLVNNREFAKLSESAASLRFSCEISGRRRADCKHF
jgi:hypothetical protein